MKFRTLFALCTFALSGCGDASASQAMRQASSVQLRKPQVHIGYVAHTYTSEPMVNAGAAVWAMDRGSPKDYWSKLQTSALTPWRPRDVVRSRHGMGNVAVSRGWFSWIEAPMHSGSVWWLWAQSRSSGKRILVDTSRWEGPGSYRLDPPFSSLYGNTLVWTFSACPRPCRFTWNSAVKVVTLPHTAPRTIVATSLPGCNYTIPSVSSHLLVWTREGYCTPAGGSDIMAYWFDDHRLRLLTHDHLSSAASTNGTYVAWERARAGLDRRSIVLRDMRTGQTRTVDKSDSALLMVSARAVTWRRDDLGIVQAFDFRQRRTYTVFPPSYRSRWAVVPPSYGSGGDTISMDGTWVPWGPGEFRGAVVWVTMP